MRLLITILLMFTFTASADHHAEEKAVLAAVDKYYTARTDRDFKTMVAMESKSGVCSTNSDGSFHKACVIYTAEEYAKIIQMDLTTSIFQKLQNLLRMHIL